MPPARRGRAKGPRIDAPAGPGAAASEVNGAGWAVCMPAHQQQQQQQQQQSVPMSAPLPGGFKSMKNRWLAEFQAEQAAKQAAERAAHTAQQEAAAAACIAQEPVVTFEPESRQAAAGVVQLADPNPQPHNMPANTSQLKHDSKAQPLADKAHKVPSNGAAAMLRGEEHEAAVPDTSSAHSEAEQQLRIGSVAPEDQLPAHQLPEAVRSAVPPHLLAPLDQDVASPASDADSTKQHSPPGRVAVADLGQGQHAAGAAIQLGSDDRGAGEARKGSGPRKRRAAVGPEWPATAAPDAGDARPSSVAPDRRADDTGAPAHLQRPADIEDSAGGAFTRPAAGSPSEQQQPRQPLDTRQPADSARPGVRPHSPKRLGSHTAVPPVQNGKKTLPQAGSVRSGAPRDDSKVRVKPEPPASRSDSRHAADAPTAPGQQGHAAGDIPKPAVTRQPQHEPAMPQQQQGTVAPGQAKDWASGVQKAAAEAARPNGDGAAARVPVGLHQFSGSGTTLPLGELDLHACSCHAEVLQEVYAKHGAKLPKQDSVQLTYEDDVGDWMLLHAATPWGQFVAGARRVLVTA